MKDRWIKGFLVLIYGFLLWRFNPFLNEYAYKPFGEHICIPFFRWAMHHWVEGFFGLLFAFLFWLFDDFLRERLYKPFLRWVKSVKAKISSSSERVIPKTEVNNSIIANLPKLEKTSLVHAIDIHRSLTNSTKYHYRIGGNYHRERRFKLLPLLGGDSSFFNDACGKIADLLNDKNLNLVLYLDNPTNQLFAQEVCKGLLKRVNLRPLVYNDSISQSIIDREIESLEGQNVIIVDLLFCSPIPLLKLIEFIREQHGNVLKVGILFNGFSANPDPFQAQGVEVISAYNIDLKIFPEPQCERCKLGQTVTKPLLYKDYTK